MASTIGRDWQERARSLLMLAKKEIDGGTQAISVWVDNTPASRT